VEHGDISDELEEIEFSSKLRGYDPFEVDEILERARSEILDLRSRVHVAEERVRSMEEQLDSELTVIRQEREEVEETRAVAEREAEGVVTRAQAESDRLMAAAEVEVREAIQKGRDRLREELEVLEVRRDEARDAIEIADVQLAAHRERILTALEDLRALTESLACFSDSGRSQESVSSFPNRPIDSSGITRRMEVVPSAAETEESITARDQVI
jgi:DivIVA domain-containing protein